MTKISDNTMRELEDILNGSETYADRLTAFLKLKTAAKPQSKTPFVLSGFDVSFDVDVDLVKLSPKPQAEDPQILEPKEQTLREITKNPIAVERPTSPVCENVPPALSPTNSPRRSRRSGGSYVPGSDRLRRVAIQRRSRSLGRRDLLREFNDAASNTSNSPSGAPKGFTNSTSNTLNFLPEISSTPASAKQPEKYSTATAAIAPPTENLPLPEQIQSSSTSQRSFASASQHPTLNNGVTQRTYIVEKGPEPGQLILSPSHKNNNSNMQQRLSQSLDKTSLRQSRLRQRSSAQMPSSTAARQEILAPDTPPRIVSQSLREPEFILPESQPVQQLENIQQVLQTLSSSPVVTPFVVVPVSCVSPKPKTQVEAHRNAPVATVASRSMQTSCSPRFVQNLSDIMTDDDSNDQRESSSVPLNLAPAGGNTSRQRRLRKRNQRIKSPNQLLDLHYSRSKDSRPRNRAMRQTVLNKPSRPPINGEQFAQELARMSNYEILDLRKRHSRGKVHPLNAHRQKVIEQQVIDEQIQWEIIRRNLEKTCSNPSKANDQLSSASPCSKSPASPVIATQNETLSALTAPPGFTDNSVQEQHSMDHQVPKKEQHRHSRLRRRETPRLEKKSTSASTEMLSPKLPPDDFRDSPMQKQRSVLQHKTPKRGRRRVSRREPTMSEDELLAVCTPPSEFRCSKSRQQESFTFTESGVTALLAPPEQFRRSKSTIIDADPGASKQQEEVAVVEPNVTTLTDLSDQFRLSTCKQQKSTNVEPGFTSMPVPSLPCIDEVRTNAEDKEQEEEIDIQFNNGADQISSHKEQMPMEALLLGETVLDELPSTSNAARKEVSKIRRKNTKSKVSDEENRQEKQMLPSEDVFKKPTAPAPRSKRNHKLNKSKRELENLRITLVNEALVPEGTESMTDQNSTGVRKSKRGHVPLRNTWVHTPGDPFYFMRKTYERFLKPSDSKPKNQSGANSTTLLLDRPPLSSSTPRNASPITNTITSIKRKRKEHNNQDEENNDPNQICISGITPLSNIAEQLEEIVPEQPIEMKVAKKRGRKKKIKVVETNPPPPKKHENKGSKKEKVVTSETQDDPEPEPISIQSTPTTDDQNQIESAPEFEPASQSMKQPQGYSFPLVDWLRDADRTISNEGCHTEEESDSLVISRAANLQFSNLNGIDYAFYNGEDNYSVGYMRLQALQVRGFNRAKRKLQFVALYGQFDIEVNIDGSEAIGPLTEQYIMNAGDLVEIKKGNRYNITNRLNEVSILLINRK